MKSNLNSRARSTGKKSRTGKRAADDSDEPKKKKKKLLWREKRHLWISLLVFPNMTRSDSRLFCGPMSSYCNYLR